MMIVVCAINIGIHKSQTLFTLTLVMLAFAGNSLLSRAGLLGGDITPFAFYAIRIISGAMMLTMLMIMRGQKFKFQGSLFPALALSLYAVCFTFAYVHMDAGLGALVLFGTVQLTMFVGGLHSGERPVARAWLGMALGICGLLLIAQPSGQGFSYLALILMIVAGVAWGAFSLLGRKAGAPLTVMTASFVLGIPIMLVLFPFFEAPFGNKGARGILLAITSGAITSGLGYALWYQVLPSLRASTAAVAQLSVPVIAMVLGVVLLGETLNGIQMLASVIIISGIAITSLSK